MLKKWHVQGLKCQIALRGEKVARRSRHLGRQALLGSKPVCQSKPDMKIDHDNRTPLQLNITICAWLLGNIFLHFLLLRSLKIQRLLQKKLEDIWQNLTWVHIPECDTRRRLTSHHRGELFASCIFPGKSLITVQRFLILTDCFLRSDKQRCTSLWFQSTIPNYYLNLLAILKCSCS